MSEAVNNPDERKAGSEPLSDGSLEEVAGICSFMMCPGDMDDAP